MKSWLVLFLCFSMAILTAEVYDCFNYLNEWEVLEIRFHELDEEVDYFVLVEATETFQGNLKPLHFKEVEDRFSKFAHKIRHVVIEDHYETDSFWARESYQRNQIMRGLQDCKPDDIILLSDCDEIPRATSVREAIARISSGETLVGFIGPMYRFFLNYRDNDWLGTQAVTFATIEAETPQGIRQKRGLGYLLFDAGWHFSGMGGYERFMEKICSFSHSEESCGRPTEDDWNRWVEGWLRDVEPVDDTYPLYVQQNLPFFIERGLVAPWAGQ